MVGLLLWMFTLSQAWADCPLDGVQNADLQARCARLERFLEHEHPDLLPGVHQSLHEPPDKPVAPTSSSASSMFRRLWCLSLPSSISEECERERAITP